MLRKRVEDRFDYLVEVGRLVDQGRFDDMPSIYGPLRGAVVDNVRGEKETVATAESLSVAQQVWMYDTAASSEAFNRRAGGVLSAQTAFYLRTKILQFIDSPRENTHWEAKKMVRAQLIADLEIYEKHDLAGLWQAVFEREDQLSDCLPDDWDGPHEIPHHLLDYDQATTEKLHAMIQAMDERLFLLENCAQQSLQPLSSERQSLLDLVDRLEVSDFVHAFDQLVAFTKAQVPNKDFSTDEGYEFIQAMSSKGVEVPNTLSEESDISVREAYEFLYRLVCNSAESPLGIFADSDYWPSLFDYLDIVLLLDYVPFSFWRRLALELAEKIQPAMTQLLPSEEIKSRSLKLKERIEHARFQLENPALRRSVDNDAAA